MAASSWHGINFIIGIIALLLVVLIYVIVFEHRSRFENFGTGWNVFLSTDLVVDSDQSEDIISLPTGGHNFLIVNRNVPTTVRVLQNDNNHEGLEIGVKNSGTQNVILSGSSQTTFTSISNLQGGTTTLPPGQAVTMVFVQNRFIITSSDPLLRGLNPPLEGIQSPGS